MNKSSLRLGTRGSLLARTQSQLVASDIERANPGVQVELVILKTTGDQVQDKPLAEIGGKGLFTKELELALLREQIDLAVHSFKDVPVTMPLVDQTDLIIAAVPLREDPRDVLAVSGDAISIDSLPPNARVGTGSLRRQCQLLAIRPDLRITPVRGNIDTRLRKLHEREFDAIVLAYAGLKRVGLFDGQGMMILSPDEMLPAPGQGALALQCRKADIQTRDLLAALNDPITEKCVSIERQVVRLLNGDCHSPIAALATVHEKIITLQTAIGESGGNLPVRRSSATSEIDSPHFLAATALGIYVNTDSSGG